MRRSSRKRTLTGPVAAATGSQTRRRQGQPAAPNRVEHEAPGQNPMPVQVPQNPMPVQVPQNPMLVQVPQNPMPVQVPQNPMPVQNPMEPPVAHNPVQAPVPILDQDAPGQINGNAVIQGPLPLPSVSSPLGLHVCQTIKDKITQGIYLDIACLLDTTSSVNSPGRLILNNSGNLCMAPESQRKIYSIEEWSDAFLVFASIYLSAHPTKTQEVLKYFSTIRLAAKRHMGAGWKSYDCQFRMRFASNPATMSFGLIDQELWLIFMGPSTMSTYNNERKCYDYNFRTCFKNFCPYNHSCLNCSGSHQAHQCRQNSSSGGPMRAIASRGSQRSFVPRGFVRPSFRPRLFSPRPRF